MVKLLLESLTNEKLSLIYIEVIREGGDMVIRFADKMDHISGYYLLRFNKHGMSKFEDVGSTDTPEEVIKSIRTDRSGKLEIVGVDLV